MMELVNLYGVGSTAGYAWYLAYDRVGRGQRKGRVRVLRLQDLSLHEVREPALERAARRDFDPGELAARLERRLAERQKKHRKCSAVAAGGVIAGLRELAAASAPAVNGLSSGADPRGDAAETPRQLSMLPARECEQLDLLSLLEHA